MVQVDVFWSFAVGSQFAAFAAKQLEGDDKPFESRSFVKNLLWLAVFFVPSGGALLWGFPSWETMHVGTYGAIPAWLVALFCGTNITQGILGYWISYKLIQAKKLYAANFMWILGYFLMFFILVHGWDGTGYQRFFYCERSWSGVITPWQRDTFTPGQVLVWLKSPVAATLGAMGVIMMPFLFSWLVRLFAESLEGETKKEFLRKGYIKSVLIILGMVFGASLGTAIVSSILIHKLGWILGVIIFVVAAYFLLFRPQGPIDKLVMKSYGPVGGNAA